MAEMDLIPDEFRRTLRLQRLVRNFVSACLLVVGGVAIAWVALGYLVSSEKAQVARLQQQESLAESNRAKAAELQRRKHEIEEQLVALAKLRGEKRVPLLLSAVDRAHDEGIWFDSVQFLRRAAAVNTAANPPGAVKAAGILVVPNTPAGRDVAGFDQSVDITGHALNHSVLADFMGRLGAQAGVSDLRLIDTRLRDYLTTQVVDFTLNLQVGKQPVTAP